MLELCASSERQWLVKRVSGEVALLGDCHVVGYSDYGLLRDLSVLLQVVVLQIITNTIRSIVCTVAFALEL